jgi:hypothetical protein
VLPSIDTQCHSSVYKNAVAKMDTTDCSFPHPFSLNKMAAPSVFHEGLLLGALYSSGMPQPRSTICNVYGAVAVVGIVVVMLLALSTFISTIFLLLSLVLPTKINVEILFKGTVSRDGG